MKWLVIPLLGVIFVALITCSIQSISADHLEPDQGIFKDRSEVDLVTTHDSDYQVYLQAVLRNGDGQLINVTENTKTAAYIPHEIADYVFDTLMGEKEIITIDNIKYEKVQYTFSPTLEQRTVKHYPIFEEIPIKHELDKDTRAQMKEDIRDYHRWNIHYCATFFELGHPYVCLSVFQSFSTVHHVEPTDVITHQWTILRVLN